jgi:hypothetical protein
VSLREVAASRREQLDIFERLMIETFVLELSLQSETLFPLQSSCVLFLGVSVLRKCLDSREMLLALAGETDSFDLTDVDMLRPFGSRSLFEVWRREALRSYAGTEEYTDG